VVKEALEELCDAGQERRLGEVGAADGDVDPVGAGEFLAEAMQ